MAWDIVDKRRSRRWASVALVLLATTSGCYSRYIGSYVVAPEQAQRESSAQLADEVLAAIKPFGFVRGRDTSETGIVAFQNTGAMQPSIAALKGSDAKTLVAVTSKSFDDDVRITISDYTYNGQTPYTAELEAAIAKLLGEQFGIAKPEFNRIRDWPLGP